jgi:hypothetical protein
MFLAELLMKVPHVQIEVACPIILIGPGNSEPI